MQYQSYRARAARARAIHNPTVTVIHSSVALTYNAPPPFHSVVNCADS